MNCVYIMGGLGNQLFQYVFFRYLQRKGIDITVIRKDFYLGIQNSGGQNMVRDFLLDKFNTGYISLEGENVNSCCCSDETYTDEFLNRKNILYMGYWQNVKFFQAVKKDILNELALKPEYIDESMQACADDMSSGNSVALHVRRSDYLNPVNTNIFEQLTLDYYMQAVSLIKERTGSAPTIYVFSDDYEYVCEHMQNFMGHETIIMKPREPYQDIYLMSKAKHNIIANSTFSWWGAALNEKPYNITIAPSRWLKGKAMNLYLENWVVL